MPSFIRNYLREIHQHALAEYPFECCGVLLGKPGEDGDNLLIRCKNIQNQLHAKDPAHYPRDARTAYTMDPKDQLKIDSEARNRGMTIKVFYHSHPDHEAYFSEEDRKMALFNEEPLYPEARYLVVSVVDKKIKGDALFA
nr:M67 family metallopeptidase [Nitrospinaceae bacterium]NIR55113.1 M67 family metallopeptidase [Nitrospinaceae bacterium]NIS85534.1 M67 family metallopeptidase [Nitrospinaceae bacterium]NIT82368.1 M67 family metallopeptidase [Nitrospinaceae bacterium]NIU44581.1 M67 family metallopeptidase [Nitrospinaceae bacterium]